MRNSTLLIFLVFIQNGLLAQIEEIPSRLGNLSNNSKEISGARISAEKEASKIAIAAYIKKMNLNISSGEALRVTDVVTLGFDIPGYAQRGDKLWQLRPIENFTKVRGLIWVHSETGEVYFVSGSWEVSNNDTATTRPQPRVKTDESGRILSLEGSLISSQLDAGRIAFEDYGRRNESEDPKTVIGMKFYTMTLGYSIPGFANKGDRLWEVRIMTPNGELRSIIWIDPVTGRTHLLTGPWLAQVNNATSEESTD